MGKRNYPFFFAFLVSTVLDALFVLVLDLVTVCSFVTTRTTTCTHPKALHLMGLLGHQYISIWVRVDRKDSAMYMMGHYPDVLISALSVLIVVLFTGNLLCYHIKLIRTNATTNEDMKGMHRRGNVFLEPSRPAGCQCWPACRSWRASSIRYTLSHGLADRTLTLRPLLSGTPP